ncbi:MAG: crossover junction endodeoxyribonuclease RuvC [Gammaproteobacteria bacterium]|nr:crossover junction endodeoxyribonuclease RuvC [Gammaproteobacteria bacterium]MDE0285297.1 crossover junction endodeoxyribonuclease RuvC [Gammaproteobacteria bacterium]MDE0513445.1 crossover junction endodeoxyribonuclease RuvC [Gammaproteobacteria bacterium]
MHKLRILGIDPGSLHTGYGLIDMDGNRAVHVTHGQVTTQAGELSDRLRQIFRGIGAVINEFTPDECAVEKVFMYRNADSALKLGQSRGAAITVCAERDLPVFEYTANQVKQATVGKGHAEKAQVQYMVKVLLCLEGIPQADAADALAVALCHGHSRENIMRLRELSTKQRGQAR